MGGERHESRGGRHPEEEASEAAYPNAVWSNTNQIMRQLNQKRQRQCSDECISPGGVVQKRSNASSSNCLCVRESRGSDRSSQAIIIGEEMKKQL